MVLMRLRKHQSGSPTSQSPLHMTPARPICNGNHSTSCPRVIYGGKDSLATESYTAMLIATLTLAEKSDYMDTLDLERESIVKLWVGTPELKMVHSLSGN